MQITPGQDGYQALLEIPDYGENPYSAIAQQSFQQMQASGQAAQQGVEAAMGKIESQGQQLAKMQSGYPSFPNDFGLGSQQVSQAPPQASAPPPAGPSSASSGMNPWSMQGEALSR